MRTTETVRDAFASCPAQAKLDDIQSQIKKTEESLLSLREKELNLKHRLNAEHDGVANKLDKACPGWREKIWREFAKGNLVQQTDDET